MDEVSPLNLINLVRELMVKDADEDTPMKGLFMKYLEVKIRQFQH